MFTYCVVLCGSDGFKAYSRSKRIEVKGLNPLAKPSKISKDLMDMWVALAYSERLKWKGIEEVMVTQNCLQKIVRSKRKQTDTKKHLKYFGKRLVW